MNYILSDDAWATIHDAWLASADFDDRPQWEEYKLQCGFSILHATDDGYMVKIHNEEQFILTMMRIG